MPELLLGLIWWIIRSKIHPHYFNSLSLVFTNAKVALKSNEQALMDKSEDKKNNGDFRGSSEFSQSEATNLCVVYLNTVLTAYK